MSPLCQLFPPTLLSLLFLSGPEYRWMTVLPKKPRLPLTNLAAAFFSLICSHCLPLRLNSFPRVSADFDSSDLYVLSLSVNLPFSPCHFFCEVICFSGSILKKAHTCLVTPCALWQNTTNSWSRDMMRNAMHVNALVTHYESSAVENFSVLL